MILQPLLCSKTFASHSLRRIYLKSGQCADLQRGNHIDRTERSSPPRVTDGICANQRLEQNSRFTMSSMVKGLVREIHAKYLGELRSLASCVAAPGILVYMVAIEKCITHI